MLRPNFRHAAAITEADRISVPNAGMVACGFAERVAVLTPIIAPIDGLLRRAGGAPPATTGQPAACAADGRARCRPSDSHHQLIPDAQLRRRSSMPLLNAGGHCVRDEQRRPSMIKNASQRLSPHYCRHPLETRRAANTTQVLAPVKACGSSRDSPAAWARSVWATHQVNANFFDARGRAALAVDRLQSSLGAYVVKRRTKNEPTCCALVVTVGRWSLNTRSN